jgi:DNA-directed RNA polymerase specialized sigma24 family protein
MESAIKGERLLRVRADPSRDQHDLAQLLVLAAAGNTDAFERFYDGTIDVVYRFALVCTADAGAAHGVVRSVYRRAWETAGGHAASGLSPLAWLLHGQTRLAMFNSLLRSLWT